MTELAVPLVTFLALGIGVIVLLARRSDDSAWLIRMLVAGFMLRVVVVSMFSIFPEARIFHDDAEGYELAGLALAKGWLGEGPNFPLSMLGQNYGYAIVTGSLYYVFGRFKPVPAFVNAILGVVVAYVLYQLARRFFHRLVARRAALLAIFFPSMILWSSIALKDQLVTLLILISLAGCVRLKERFTPGNFIATTLPIVMIQPIRFYVIYFLVFAIVASLILERGMNRLVGVSKQFAVVGGLVALLALTGFLSNAQRGLDMLSLEQVSSFRHGMAASAQSGFAENVDISNPLAALAFLPIGMAVLLFGPFPWQFTSARSLFAAPEMLLWWWMVPSLYRGVKLILRRRLVVISPVLLFTFTLTCSYSLIHGNVGSGFRQRAQIFVYLFIFTALGYYQKKLNERGLSEELLFTSGDALPVATLPAGQAAIG